MVEYSLLKTELHYNPHSALDLKFEFELQKNIKKSYPPETAQMWHFKAPEDSIKAQGILGPWKRQKGAILGPWNSQKLAI